MPTHHHQAVDQLGSGLTATAWTADGIVEAAELSPAQHPFAVAVQWHPEAGEDLSLFVALAAAAAGQACPAPAVGGHGARQRLTRPAPGHRGPLACSAMASETSDDRENPAGEGAGADAKPEEPQDDLVTTHHEITVDGTALPYTVQAGRVVLRKEQIGDDEFAGAKATAEVFVVAYTADNAGDPAQRPVTFAFNGGPGSSSVWLHLGLLGPRRVLMGDAGALLPPPYGLADNEQTLLGHSDLVFIDPVSTGFSRAVKGGKSGDFHGFGGDIESVGEVIRLWTTRNGPLDVAQVPVRRVLRHHQGRGPGPASAGALRACT